MKPKIAVSACLLGHLCKYNGGHNLDSELVKSLQGYEVIPVCPEELGGLSTPRIPSEIQSDGHTVLDQTGKDVTAFFERGKLRTLAILREQGCDKIILKDGSPSCGYTWIYDGTFSRSRIRGEGVTAQYLRQNGVSIIDRLEEGEL